VLFTFRKARCKPTLNFGKTPRARREELWLIRRMTHRTDANDARLSFAGNPLVASVLRENVRIVDVPP
jgi:hypothetical protein